MQVFFADVMECADDASLEDAPKVFNRLGMDRTNDILVFCMVNGPVRKCKSEVPLANPLIGTDQANLVRDCFIYESFQGGHQAMDGFVALAMTISNPAFQ
jgi:hypothetical protein